MPVSPFDIARAHVRLPIHRDYGALKTALRDWRRYAEHTSLSDKVAFPAALCVVVRRPSPSALFGDRTATATSSRSLRSSFAGKLDAWRRRYEQGGGGNGGNASAKRDADQAPAHVYMSRVPLALYTALLPWEVQRGLSQAELVLPKVMKEEVTNSAGEEEDRRGDGDKVRKVADEEEDPFGVVTTGSAKSHPSPTGTVAQRTPAAAAAAAVREPASPVPGMLFVLDLKGVQESGGQIGFWSGAITRPIDVLFFAPTEATTVAESASLQRIRRQDVRMQVEDNEVAPDVVARFFPRNELRSAGRYALRLHTYGHLDPFPWCEAGGGDKGKEKEEERRFSVEATLTREERHADAATWPRIVLETIRHTVGSHVQQAVAESLVDYRRVYGDHGVTALEATNRKEADVDLEITLELSDALAADLMNKAQLHVHYVSMLESAVASYATDLNRLAASDAGAEPITEEWEEVASAGAAGHGGEQRMQVWLSETEQVWMTPSELAAYQREQTRKHHQTPWEAKLRQEEEEEEDLIAAVHAGEQPRSGGSLVDNNGAASSPPPPSPSPLFVTPARAGSVRGDKSIGHQSPMLADETEGRPSYLSPSFIGRHEAPTLSQLTTVSADRLARYPSTRSGMPALPPIDYELLDLCLRLGVGQSSVLYHYYERILREWRQELKALRSPPSSPSDTGGRDSAASTTRIADEDVQRMSALVHDASLQVPEELRSLVDAVSAARKRGGLAPLGK